MGQSAAASSGWKCEDSGAGSARPAPPPPARARASRPQVSNSTLAAVKIPGGGPAVSTLPTALFVIAAAASVLPGAISMKRFGRRPVVLAAAALGLAGAGLEVLSLFRAGFPLLVLGALLQVCAARGGLWAQSRVGAARSRHAPLATPVRRASSGRRARSAPCRGPRRRRGRGEAALP